MATPPTPPAPNRTGRTIAIVAAVTVPVLVIIMAAVGFLVVPRLLDDQQAGPGSSPTSPAPSEDPLAVPAVGSCYMAVLPTVMINQAAEDGRAVSCEEPHTLETVAVGEIEDSTWPDAASDEARALYAECDAAASEFLGVAWRSTYTWPVLSVPSRSAWNDGARWYRCDLTFNDGYYQVAPGRTTGSLRDTAEPIACLTWFETDSTLEDITRSDCDVEHQGELAGVFPVPADLDLNDQDAVVDALSDACNPVVLEFLGMSSLPDELTFWFSYPSEGDLDQWVLCLASAFEANRGFTASLEGIGSGPIPFA